MSDMTEGQAEKRAAIQKSATIIGVIVGVIAGLLALWLLGGQGTALRYGGAVVIGVVIGVLVSRASFKSQSKSAQCEKCGAAFSRSRSDHAETLVASEQKEEREALEDGSKKVTTWVDETYDVVDSYACSSCGDVTTREYQTNRRRDEKETVFPAEPAPAPAAESGKKGGEKSGGGQRGGARGRKG